MHHALTLLNPAHRLLSWTQRPGTSCLHTLPADVLLEIASYLNTLSDILHLGLTSYKVYLKVIPAVYAFVELQGPSQCEATLAMLQRRPDVARHVRKLVLRPEDQLTGRKQQVRAWDNAGMISRMVSDAAKYLDALQEFEWDGEDMLPDDRMWSGLRSCCPYLQRVGMTFGCFLPHPGSNLFKFSDLAGFSLTFKDGFYAQQLHVPSRESEPVFARLWDMLVRRCPNLETLSIAGTSTEPSDAARLGTAYWPKLRVLTIGDVVFGLSVPLDAPPAHPFLGFLERHPTLTGLHILGHPHVNPLDLAELSEDALPQLTEFSGSLDHLRALMTRGQPNAGNGNPNLQWNVPQGQDEPSSPLSKTLRHICLPDPMQLRELTPLAISRVLLDLHALTSLKMTFTLHSGYDCNGVFRTVIASCPQLLHLDLTCTSRPSFYLESFSRSLKKLVRLRTLRLSIVQFPGEEPMHAGAARIALANPRLTQFFLSYIPPHTPALPIPRPLETGSFELICDIHGIPINLFVSEWRVTLAGGGGGGMIWRGMVSLAMILGIGVGTGWRAGPTGWTRRWKCELRPSGHPDVPRSGLDQLIVERSPAGEEARLLLLCMCLLILAAWGVVWRAS